MQTARALGCLAGDSVCVSRIEGASTDAEGLTWVKLVELREVEHVPQAARLAHTVLHQLAMRLARGVLLRRGAVLPSAARASGGLSGRRFALELVAQRAAALWLYVRERTEQAHEVALETGKRWALRCRTVSGRGEGTTGRG